ncbi:alpha-L-rhamnosidase N-terminal domain-containing protein [Chitinophaga nivalis]|uniref:Alpha-L-rhamnosidase N-terminal domain-containing protein n=1 Tax=Chitinophaga nivalis TaxID=2991709 RepID=A0ABT3ITD7_9BACT|nr:alpha-L-rhamnosidase N-terminal domain-containing protein [Chitinophaga nivalis]MCW3463069.1 alpha-L-rhamnosidase N-terminal domain-containing protein [Chitinophaga nivalis]MCW3487241.1 alpha-L-rhamnosidase N-terminal domain-containing protein [Chitinophaga nivalis]
MKNLQQYARASFLTLFIAISFLHLMAQATTGVAAVKPQQWNAQWITAPGAIAGEAGRYLFRKQIDLSGYSGPFIIHLTADTRYRLLVNGRLAGIGPARGDLANWYYETIDIGPYLKYGNNVIAVTVLNYGACKPHGLFSMATGLLLQGSTPREAALVNTGTTSWQVLTDPSFDIHPLKNTTGRFYGAYAGDSIQAQYYPWGWELADYKDSSWEQAVPTGRVHLQGTSAPSWRLLTPAALGALQQEATRFKTIVKQTGVTADSGFLKGVQPLTLPAKRKSTLLLDYGHFTTGFPEILLSGGADATVKINYLQEPAGPAMVQDIMVPDGGKRRRFSPSGYRSFRYVQLEVETGKTPLIIEDYCHVYTQYAFTDKSVFQGDAVTENAWRHGSLLAAAGAQDNLYNNLWEEQLQYGQEARIHGQAILCFSGDDRLWRNALLQADQSRIPEGLVRLRYPADDRMVHIADALTWIGTIQDYLLYRDDKALAKQLLPGIRQILDWMNRYQDAATGLPGNMPYRDSMAIAPLTMQYLYALRQGAAVAGYCGRPEDSLSWQRTADKLREVIYQQCYDTDKGLYAESPDKKTFSPYTSALAILAQAVPPRQVKGVLQRLLHDNQVASLSLKEQYYLLKAIQETGITGEATQLQAALLGRNTAGNEAVSCVANLFLLGITAGIQPASYGFKSVLIAPDPGKLPRLKAVMAHPDGGTIEADLTFTDNRVTGTVKLPYGITGRFRWRGKDILLNGGTQQIR